MTDPWLSGTLMNAVYGWRLERRDGVTLGFTSHDRDMELDGLLHRSSPGMQPSSILESLGLDTDGLEVTGAIDAAAISEEDLTAGRWDGAKVTIYLFDWTQPLAGKRQLASGELGEVSFSNAEFQADLRGLTSLLDAPIVPQTSPGCRAEFCGNACGLNVQRFRHLTRVASVSSDQVTLTAPLSASFAYGKARWLNGPNCGLVSDIVASGGSTITLARMPSGAGQPGATLLLTEGCDKTLATCSGRFGNAINFRGEPHLPGNDLLTRYPGAG
jgi:uncharacterized phage protein (TIGR02218 family)